MSPNKQIDIYINVVSHDGKHLIFNFIPVFIGTSGGNQPNQHPWPKHPTDFDCGSLCAQISIHLNLDCSQKTMECYITWISPIISASSCFIQEQNIHHFFNSKSL